MFCVPLSGQDLRHVITHPEDTHVIDVQNSQLQSEQLLVYLTNLDIKVSLHFETTACFQSLLIAYMHSAMFHELTQLEVGVLELLGQIKGYPPESGFDYHDMIVDPDNRAIIRRWLSLVESLSVYAMTWVDRDETDTPTFPVIEDQNLAGINFVRLLNHATFPFLLEDAAPDRLFFYEHFFTRRVFRGSSLEHYWMGTNNPLHAIIQAYNHDPALLNDLETAIDTDLDDIQKEASHVSPNE